MSTPDANTITSVEQDGRTLSGVGVSVDALEAVMDRHAPETPDAPPAAPDASPQTVEGTQTAPPAQPPQTRGRQRFSDLTKARDEAAARADAAEKRAAELEARLSQAPPVAPPTAAPQPAQMVAPQQAAPETFTFPNYDIFIETNPNASYEDWQRAQLFAFSEWKDARTNLDARIRQSIEADREQRDFLATIERTRAKGREVYADFDAALASGPGGQVPLGPTAADAFQRAKFIILHPHSEHIQYAIFKDGDLARRLQQLDPISFGIEIAKLAPSGSGASLASPARSGSAMPPPPFEPVGTGSKTTVPPSAELAKRGFDFDKSGYREKRAAERGVTRRR